MEIIRKVIRLTGTCSGVGFRLFVQQLAAELHLAGSFTPTESGGRLELEGEPDAVDSFIHRLAASPPGSAHLDRVEAADAEPRGETGFGLREPEGGAPGETPPPEPFATGRELPSILAVGAELEWTACRTEGDRLVFSPGLGDVQAADRAPHFRRAVEALAESAGAPFDYVARDLHPDYYASRWASGRKDGVIVAVQHHEAHVAACLADCEFDGEAIGVVLDGAGLGADGTIWGGEFLVGSAAGFRRLGHVRTVPLPGAERAAREPWRMAYSWMDAAVGDRFLKMDLQIHQRVQPPKYQLLMQAIRRNINAPPTSCIERFLDGMASILDLRDRSLVEGQAASEISALYDGADAPPYPLATMIRANGMVVLDLAETVQALLHDVVEDEPRARIVARLFETLAFLVLTGCDRIRRKTGVDAVALTGRVFRNEALTERARTLLDEGGFRVLTHRRLSPGDSSICVGQALIAAARRDQIVSAGPVQGTDRVLL